MELILKNPVILVTLFNLNILLLKKHSGDQQILDYMYIFSVEVIVCNILLLLLKL